jgi:hypothetical protein
MTQVRSRVMARLDAAIAAAPNPVEYRCLRAERAALLARQGQLQAARAVIDELNTQLAWQPNVPLRAWLAWAEGLHDHYSSLGQGARSHIEQAYALAQGAVALQRLRALAAAWLAVMAFADDDMPRVAALLREAFDTALPEHHGARARAALVAGDVYHAAAGGVRAQPWYEAVRRHAIADGDETQLSALMYNQAAVRASRARLARLFDASGGADAQDDAAAHALMGAESIGHYDAGIGTASLGSLVPMLRAQVLAAQGQWTEALALFDTHFDAALVDGPARMAPCWLADRAWCEWHQGKTRKAEALTAAAEQALLEPCDTDDRAMANARLAQVHAALGNLGAAQRHRDASLAHYAEHREQQQRIVALLDQALAGLDPVCA